MKPICSTTLKKRKNSQADGKLAEYNMVNWPTAFSKLPEETDPVIMGFELEAKHSEYKEFIRDAVRSPLGDHVSFREEYANDFEMVSIPASLGYHKQVLKEFFNLKDFIVGVDSGMHVHISKKNFINEEHVRKFIGFIVLPSNRHFVTHISGRGMGRWCKANTVKFYHSKNKQMTGNSIQFQAGKKFEVRPPMKRIVGIGFREVPRTNHDSGSKSVAVNTFPKDTIELRIFKSPNTMHKLLTNLEFVDAMVRYTKSAPHDKLHWRHFLRWVRAQKCYPHLCYTKKNLKV